MTVSLPTAAVYGNPVAHSLSPLIHSFWLNDLGLEGVYLKRHASDATDFERKLKSDIQNGLRGANITIPFKEKAYELCDSVDETAQKLQAVNCIVVKSKKIHGFNTDALGYAHALNETFGEEWAKTRASHPALVIGAGGASRAIVYALISNGFEQIYLANRTRERASELARIFHPHITPLSLDDLSAIIPKTQFIVNTTSLGMKNTPNLTLDLSSAQQETLVSDIIYTPAKTPLLTSAEHHNLKIINGLGMLVHQAKPAFEAFYGASPMITPELYEELNSALHSNL